MRSSIKACVQPGFRSGQILNEEMHKQKNKVKRMFRSLSIKIIPNYEKRIVSRSELSSRNKQYKYSGPIFGLIVKSPGILSVQWALSP